MAGLEAAHRLLQLRAVSQIALQTLGGGGAQVALGGQSGGQGRDARVAGSRLDGAADTEGGPAALTRDAAIAGVTGRQIGVAQVRRGQGVEPLAQLVGGDGVDQAARQVDAVLLHLPQLFHRLGPDAPLGQNLGVRQGGGGGADFGRLAVGGQADEVEEVSRGQAVTLGALGDFLQDAQAVGGPDRLAAGQLIDGADVSLLGRGQAAGLGVEAGDEDLRVRGARLGQRPVRGCQRQARRGDAKAQFPSVHRL